MNKILLYSIIALLSMVVSTTKAQIYNLSDLFVQSTFLSPYPQVTERNLSTVILDNGVYELSVKYSSNTVNEKQYKLHVRIQNDYVTCIYFPNGGYVHSGDNDSNYRWRGGGIKWDLDIWDNIIGGTAIMHLEYEDSERWQLFKIDF